MVKFILLSHPRSGTNNLIRILNEHPEIHCAGELYNELDDGPRYVESLGLPNPAGSADIAFLDSFYERARRREGREIIGFKLFGYQLPERELLLLAGDPGIKKLYVHRENLLRAYVSVFHARQTRQWRLREGEERRLPPRCEVDLDEARHWMIGRRLEELVWKTAMIENGVGFLECPYETLFTQGSLDRIYRFLGAGPRAGFRDHYRVQRSREGYDRLLNREELVRAFAPEFGSL